MGNDIPGAKKTIVGLTQIKGVGGMFAKAMINLIKLSPNSSIGYLADDQVKLIEKMIKDPVSSNFPTWFLNRQKDLETGNDMHLLTSDITLTIRNDIEREKKTSSWRGYRHMFGLKVRGQRTRCTGRKGGAVGVAKGGKILPRGGAGAPPAEGEAAEAVPTTGATTEATTTAKEVPAAEKKESPKEVKK